MRQLVLAIALACLMALSLSAQQKAPTSEQRLSHCLADLSEATQLQAAFYGGQVMTARAWAALYEKANPGETLGPDMKRQDKPKTKD